MRPAHRKPSPPPHVPRKGRLAPYDRPAERQASLTLAHSITIAEAHVALATASMSLTNHIYNEMLRDNGFPEANPLNSVQA